MLAEAQWRAYSPDLEPPTGEMIEAIASHLRAGDFPPALTDLVDEISDPRFVTGLARVLIGHGQPATGFLAGSESKYESRYAKGAERPAALVSEGLALMNAALGVTDERAVNATDVDRLAEEQLSRGGFPGRVRAVRTYAEEMRAAARTADAARSAVAAHAAPLSESEPNAPGSAGPRWRVIGGAAAAVAVIGVVGYAAASNRPMPSAPLARDAAANTVGRVLDEGAMQPLGTALDHVRTLYPGIADGSDDVTTDEASRRVDDARGLAHRTLRADLETLLEESPKGFEVLEGASFTPDYELVVEIDSEIVQGLVDVMAASGIDDARHVLDATPLNIRAQAKSLGLSELADAGLEQLAHVSEQRGGAWRSAEDESAALGQLLREPSLPQLLDDLRASALPVFAERVATGDQVPDLDLAQFVDPEVLDRAVLQYARTADANTFDYLTYANGQYRTYVLENVVMLAAALEATPDEVVLGPLKDKIDPLVVGKAPGGWATTAFANHILARTAANRWSEIYNGFANRGASHTVSLGD